MNTNWMIEATVAFLLWGAMTGWAIVAWRAERRRRREAEGRIARAIIEVALVRAHLLHFPTRWEAPLKALRCAGKALETLEGTERAVARITIHKAATCSASEIDGKAADRGT